MGVGQPAPAAAIELHKAACSHAVRTLADGRMQHEREHSMHGVGVPCLYLRAQAPCLISSNSMNTSRH